MAASKQDHRDLFMASLIVGVDAGLGAYFLAAGSALGAAILLGGAAFLLPYLIKEAVAIELRSQGK